MSNGKQISETILAQLGGSRFIAMTGAKNLSYDAAGTLSFHLPARFARNGANLVRIALDTQRDLYVLTFSKFRKLEVKPVSEHDMLDAAGLRLTFVEQTGLDIKL